MGLSHFDDARHREFDLGHLRGTWTFLGEAAGSVGVGVRRLQVPTGSWSTPAHEHGREEEIFYVLSGRGLSWQAGETAEVGPGDCIVYRAHAGAHSVHSLDALDVLAFGPRVWDESVGFPRLGLSLIGRRAVESVRGAVDGAPIQFVRESELGPPELPAEPGPRPPTIVNVDDVEGRPIERQRVVRVRRDLGGSAGSITTGLKHYVVAPGKESAPLHCHSLEEEIFVILDGSGTLVLGGPEAESEAEETPVRSGHVIARPAGTGIAHMFRAGDSELTFLAYGTREPGDMCFYPNSNKIMFGGINFVARLEPLDYWDGEP
jgi:uncharacterized cupin superfamily protein